MVDPTTDCVSGGPPFIAEGITGAKGLCITDAGDDVF